MQFERIKEMKNTLENIKAGDIINMSLSADKAGRPCLKILHRNLFIIRHPLNTGYEVYQCNEFLRTLSLVEDISFENYCQYYNLIRLNMQLLKIRKVLRAKELFHRKMITRIETITSCLLNQRITGRR